VRCSEETWNARFAELAAFQNRFGHCLVPSNWPENPALADWVRSERLRYSHNLRTHPERIVRLDAIHFVWAGGWKTLGKGWWHKRQAFIGKFYQDPEMPPEHYQIYRKPVIHPDEDDLESC
jgi:hypothetical protein